MSREPIRKGSLCHCFSPQAFLMWCRNIIETIVKKDGNMIISGSTSAFWLGIASTGSVATVHPLQLEHVRVRHLVSALDCEGGDDDGDVDIQQGQWTWRFWWPWWKAQQTKESNAFAKKGGKKLQQAFDSELWRKQNQSVAKLWKCCCQPSSSAVTAKLFSPSLSTSPTIDQ